jgi:hypothetical protein
MLVRAEHEQLEQNFGAEMLRFCSKLRKKSGMLAHTMPWPLEPLAADAYGARILTSWSLDAAPALAHLFQIAMPPKIGDPDLKLLLPNVALDDLILTVLSHYWT